jgi:hypothetical protein
VQVAPFDPPHRVVEEMKKLALRAPARIAVLLPQERRQPRDLAIHPIQLGVGQLRPLIPEQGPKNLVHRSILPC